MIEKIALKIFWAAMILCAISAIILLWFGENMNDQVFKIIPTLFIIGLASFLVWAPLVIYRFLTSRNSGLRP